MDSAHHGWVRAGVGGPDHLACRLWNEYLLSIKCGLKRWSMPSDGPSMRSMHCPQNLHVPAQDIGLVDFAF